MPTEHRARALNAATQCGEIVTWTIRNAMIDRVQLKEALEKRGVHITVREPEMATYLKRALVQCVADDMIRKVGDTPDRVCYAVGKEHCDLTTADWHGTLENAVTLWKADSRIEFREDSSMTRELREALQTNEGRLLTSDVGTVVTRALVHCANATPLRDHGGVYFVPATMSSTIDAVEEALAESKNTEAVVRLHRLRVVAGSREVSDLGVLYAEAIMQEVKKIRADAMQLMADLVKARPATFKNKVEKLGALLKQIKLYSVTLGIGFEDEIKAIKGVAVSLVKWSQRCVVARQDHYAK